MPHAKIVKSLSEICVSYIELNLHEFYTISMVGQIEVVKAIDSFAELPTILLEKIYNGFLKEDADKQVVELFITQYLRVLDLRSIFIDNEYTLGFLQLASIKCLNLKILKFSFRNEVCPDFLLYISKFTELQILDISGSVMGDSILDVVGTHCKDLKELHAKNSQVTDVGIQGLCEVGHCKLIDTLNLEGTEVTQMGIRMAIANLSALKRLSHFLIVEVLSDLVAMDQNLTQFPASSFSSLNIPFCGLQTPYRSGSLGPVVSLCSIVSAVSICVPKELMDNELICLVSLERLCHLEIWVDREDECQITFDGSILSILKSRGTSLKLLNLRNFRNVNTLSILQFCPYLYSLVFFESMCSWNWPEKSRENLSNKEFKIDEKFVLKNLETLHLKGSAIPPENVFLLLLSPSLVSINIRYCDSLTDKLFKKVSLINMFTNLEIFKIFYCPLTARGVNVLKKESNPLKEIHLVFSKTYVCDYLRSRQASITRMCYIAWREKMHERNWELLLTMKINE